MSFRNISIQAPTLYETSNVKAIQFKEASDNLMNLRDTLKNNYDLALARAGKITNEIGALNNLLKDATTEAEADTIRASIVMLENERKSVQSVLDTDISMVLARAMQSADINTLQAQAKTEHDTWMNEINAYAEEIETVRRETRQAVNLMNGSNIFRAASENLDNLETTVRKEVL